MWMQFVVRSITKEWESNKCGESLFLRKLVLGIPAQASGKNLTRLLIPSAPRFVLVTSSRPNKGSEHRLQMTWRRVGWSFILSPPSLPLRLRQNNDPTAIADYQPSHSLSMAGSVCILACLFVGIQYCINSYLACYASMPWRKKSCAIWVYLLWVTPIPSPKWK